MYSKKKTRCSPTQFPCLQPIIVTVMNLYFLHFHQSYSWAAQFQWISNQYNKLNTPIICKTCLYITGISTSLLKPDFWTCFFTWRHVVLWQSALHLYKCMVCAFFVCVHAFALFCLCFCANMLSYAVCWLVSICMPAGDTLAKSLHHWHTHFGGMGAWGRQEGARLWEEYQCVLVWENEENRMRERGGSGQAALTLRCLRPSRATDPVSNSPLLAVLMRATTSYHTICSEDCPTLHPHIQ